MSALLTLMLLVQSYVQISSACCEGMGPMMSHGAEETEQSDADMHAAMGHGEMDHGQADMAEMSHSGAQQTIMHDCPPIGCDLCSADECSQCLSFQLIPQNPYEVVATLRQLPSKIQTFTIATFVVSLNHWTVPPSRAPPHTPQYI